MNKALFLDRDGVINKEKNYLYKIEDFEFIEGIFETCSFFQDRGYLIIIITNQAGIARSKYSENDFQLLNTWMNSEFKINGIQISKVYHCPHHPKFTGECDCRKPKPGMILSAQKEYNIDLKQSILVGDKNSDIESAKMAGIAHPFLISTGHEILENPWKVKILSSLLKLQEVNFVS